MNIVWNYVSSFYYKPMNPFKRTSLDLLKTLDLIIFESEGVLKINNNPIEIAVESFNKIKSNNIPICILTNESKRSPKNLKKQLKQMKFDLSNIHFISSNLLILKKIEQICFNNRKQNFAIISNDSFNSYIQSNIKNSIKEKQPLFYFLDKNIYPNNIDYFIISSLDQSTFLEKKEIIKKWFLNNKSSKIILTSLYKNDINSKTILPLEILELNQNKNISYESVGKPNTEFILDEIKRYYDFHELNNNNILFVTDKLTDTEFSKKNNFQSCLVLSGLTKLEHLYGNIDNIDYIIPDISYLCF